MAEKEVQLAMAPPNPNRMEPSRTPKVQVSWLGLVIVALAGWFLLGGGLEGTLKTGTTIQTGATRISQTVVSVAQGVPTAIVATPTMRIVIPTQRPGVVVVPQNERTGGPPAPTEQPSAVPSPTVQPPPADCVLTTWQDGSQSCSDGRHISEAQSRPGFCHVVLVGPNGGACENGAPAGNVILPDPEVASDPTNTPWPAKVDDATIKAGTTWSGWYKDDGTSCVTVSFADGHKQTNCGDTGVHYNSANLEFIARMIIDGRLGPGGFPKG